MEKILFKDDTNVFGIDEDHFGYRAIEPHMKLDNIKHLDELDILFHYKNTINNILYPVYFELDNSFITVDPRTDRYAVYATNSYHIKDFTDINLNLL